MALPSIYLIEWSRLNGNIWKKKGTKKCKREVGVRPLAVCLRSLAKNNRGLVQQAVSKKKSALLCTPHAFSICLDGFATSEQGMNLLFNLSL